MKKIKEASQLAGVSKRTLQYYDEEGILVTGRDAGNHRIYDPPVLEQIWQILIYKEMDFELKDIRQLLKLDETQKNVCLNRKIEAIKKQMISLNVQMKFISWIQICGMPPRPGEGSGKTYVERIREIREGIRRELMKEANGK